MAMKISTSVVLLTVCALGVVYYQQASHNVSDALNTAKGMIRAVSESTRVSILDKRHLRVGTENYNYSSSSTTQGNAPMIHLESVDDHFAWFHIEKTGSSFVNTLQYYACANPPKKLGTGGANHWADEVTSISEYQCAKEYSQNPRLRGFHEPLNHDIYEHYKGKLVGMLREPKSHRISYAKHKFLNLYYDTYESGKPKGRHKWQKFISQNGFPEHDQRASTYLQFMRGFETSWLVGEPWVFQIHRETERALIDLAKHRLNEGFQYIGITNRYAESVCLFYSKFQKPWDSSGSDKTCKPQVFEAVNTAASHEIQEFEFTEEDLKYLESWDDEIDREVYNYALELFEADLRRYNVTQEACIAKGCWPEPTDIEEGKGGEMDKSGRN
eukprot:CAMPEP_0183717498 /NCGR_PEP_ID=MMETSP0737-20130205/11102_1 /TAXON_ID=385413 /ORGANISM="Thalassiosira miniscula, Strain CCMP1093" /LENGTH=384 /DNA_ID=CAMNT_0025946959 /DNA_START=83 /DNA_END=1237 /DNA_ORIENTATION=-